MDQPQKRRRAQKRRSLEHRAVWAARARAQHAQVRGFHIRPDTADEYRRAYQRLKRAGVSTEQAWAALKPIYAQGAEP